jgi:hypothetical protein
MKEKGSEKFCILRAGDSAWMILVAKPLLTFLASGEMYAPAWCLLRPILEGLLAMVLAPGMSRHS